MVNELSICSCVREMTLAEFHDKGWKAVGVTAGTSERKYVAKKSCTLCAGTGIRCEGITVTEAEAIKRNAY